MVICPEAIKAQNSMAAVSALGSANWVFTRRLNFPVQAFEDLRKAGLPD